MTVQRKRRHKLTPGARQQLSSLDQLQAARNCFRGLGEQVGAAPLSRLSLIHLLANLDACVHLQGGLLDTRTTHSCML